jgi:hypothetical protein
MKQNKIPQLSSLKSKGSSINNVTQFLNKIDPPPTLPQENELPIKSKCHCLKPENLPVHNIRLWHNIIKSNEHNLNQLETVITSCLLLIHQWPKNFITGVQKV